MVLCLHRLRNVRRGFAETLQMNAKLKITEPYDKEQFLAERIYVAPANYHLIFSAGSSFRLSVDDPVNHSRPSLDVFFESAAEVFGKNCVGVLLSGANWDGAKGMQAIHDSGGLTIVQDPLDCEVGIMTKACISMFDPDHIYDADKIINFIKNL